MTIKTRLGKLEAANAARKAIQDKYSGDNPLEIYKRMIHDRSYCPGISGRPEKLDRPRTDISPEEAYLTMKGVSGAS